MFVLGIDLWPGDLPGPKQWFSAIADMFLDSQVAMLKAAIELLFATAPAPPGVVQSDWFSYLLGSWTDLGISLLTLTLVIVHVVLMFRLGKYAGRSYVKLAGSIIGLALFIRLYFPAYAGAYKLSRRLSRSIIEQTTDGGDQDTLVESLLGLAGPGDIIGKLIGFVLSWFTALGLAATSFILFIMIMAASLLYPAALVCRSLHRSIDTFWHLLNASIVTVFVSPPFMILILCIGLFGIKAGEKITLVGGNYIGLVGQLVAQVMCMATPFIVFFVVFKNSKEMWGTFEGSVEGAVSIRNSVPLTTREAENHVRETHTSLIRDVAVPAAVATIDDKKGEPMSRRLADVVATMGASSGHMEVAAVAEFVKASIPDQPANPDRR